MRAAALMYSAPWCFTGSSLATASEQQQGWESATARPRARTPGPGSGCAVPKRAPRRHCGPPPAPAAAAQGDCCPRSLHGGNHLFANKTSILEVSLTPGHSPS